MPIPKLRPPMCPLPTEKPAPKPAAPAPESKPKPPADGFDPPRIAGPSAQKPPTLNDLKNRLLESPEFKKLSPGAQSALRNALPHIQDPKAVLSLENQLKSKWHQGLSPKEQENTVKSLLREVMTPAEKRRQQMEEIARNLRG